MWASVENLKSFQVDLRQQLNALERDWLLGRLVTETGVRRVAYHHQLPHRLIVEYDADAVTAGPLLDLLEACGVRPEPVPLFIGVEPGAASVAAAL